MTREKLMKEIAQRLREIRVLYKQAYPEADYLDITLTKDHISFNNRFWSDNEDYPIDYWEGKECINMNGIYKVKQC